MFVFNRSGREYITSVLDTLNDVPVGNNSGSNWLKADHVFKINVGLVITIMLMSILVYISLDTIILKYVRRDRYVRGTIR
jgi:hypothetical protein